MFKKYLGIAVLASFMLLFVAIEGHCAKPEITEISAIRLNSRIQVRIAWRSKAPVVKIRGASSGEDNYKEYKVSVREGNRKVRKYYYGEKSFVMKLDDDYYNKEKYHTIQVEVIDRNNRLSESRNISVRNPNQGDYGDNEDDSSRERLEDHVSGAALEEEVAGIQKAHDINNRFDIPPVILSLDPEVRGLGRISFKLKVIDDIGLDGMVLQVVSANGDILNTEEISASGKAYIGSSRIFNLDKGKYRVQVQVRDSSGTAIERNKNFVVKDGVVKTDAAPVTDSSDSGNADSVVENNGAKSDSTANSDSTSGNIDESSGTSTTATDTVSESQPDENEPSIGDLMGEDSTTNSSNSTDSTSSNSSSSPTTTDSSSDSNVSTDSPSSADNNQSTQIGGDFSSQDDNISEPEGESPSISDLMGGSEGSSDENSGASSQADSNSDPDLGESQGSVSQPVYDNSENNNEVADQFESSDDDSNGPSIDDLMGGSQTPSDQTAENNSLDETIPPETQQNDAVVDATEAVPTDDGPSIGDLMGGDAEQVEASQPQTYSKPEVILTTSQTINLLTINVKINDEYGLKNAKLNMDCDGKSKITSLPCSGKKYFSLPIIGSKQKDLSYFYNKEINLTLSAENVKGQTAEKVTKVFIKDYPVEKYIDVKKVGSNYVFKYNGEDDRGIKEWSVKLHSYSTGKNTFVAGGKNVPHFGNTKTVPASMFSGKYTLALMVKPNFGDTKYASDDFTEISSKKSSSSSSSSNKSSKSSSPSSSSKSSSSSSSSTSSKVKVSDKSPSVIFSKIGGSSSAKLVIRVTDDIGLRKVVLRTYANGKYYDMNFPGVSDKKFIKVLPINVTEKVKNLRFELSAYDSAGHCSKKVIQIN
ncbi:hypothetical protein [Maridesulfovibrio zosterae]|uniref:hypothetical protein n=1 Tax=Maridesulfovibrio zosterae TaxID=82171 RepID=UPI00042124E3|nr:hypothetical protein [Maridesulfovibrio zosterae]